MDKFTTAYAEAAIWSSTDDDGKPLDENHSIGAGFLDRDGMIHGQ